MIENGNPSQRSRVKDESKKEASRKKFKAIQESKYVVSCRFLIDYLILNEANNSSALSNNVISGASQTEYCSTVTKIQVADLSKYLNCKSPHENIELFWEIWIVEFVKTWRKLIHLNLIAHKKMGQQARKDSMAFFELDYAWCTWRDLICDNLFNPKSHKHLHIPKWLDLITELVDEFYKEASRTVKCLGGDPEMSIDNTDEVLAEGFCFTYNRARFNMENFMVYESVAKLGRLLICIVTLLNYSPVNRAIDVAREISLLEKLLNPFKDLSPYEIAALWVLSETKDPLKLNVIKPLAEQKLDGLAKMEAHQWSVLLRKLRGVFLSKDSIDKRTKGRVVFMSENWKARFKEAVKTGEVELTKLHCQTSSPHNDQEVRVD